MNAAARNSDVAFAVDVPASAGVRGSADAFHNQLMACISESLEQQAKTLIGLRVELRLLNELKDAVIEWAKCEEWADLNPDRATDPTLRREQRERRAHLLIVLWDIQRQNKVSA